MRKQLISLTIILTILLSIIIPNKVIAAAPTASISVSKSSANVGEAVTVTVSYSNVTDGRIKISASGGTLSGEPYEDLDFETDSSGSVKRTFTASTAGTYTVSFSCAQPLVNYNFEKSSPSGSKTITVKESTPTPPSGGGSDSGSGSGGSSSGGSSSGGSSSSGSSSSSEQPKNTTKPQESTETTKSDNCFLKSLSVNPGKLSPDFEKGTKNYEIVFDEGFDFSTLNNIEISAKAEDSKASVSLPKDTAVRDGSNTYNVTVYAEDSTSITYTLKLDKPEQLLDSGLRLKTLSIEQINESGESSELNFTPEFDPEVKEYSANVEEDIKSLKVNTEADEKVSVEVKGADSLQPGKNDIYIYLTTEESENVVTVYKVVVDKKGELANAVENKTTTSSKFITFIILGVIAVLALLLICLIAVNRKIKKENEEDFEDDEDEEEDSKEDLEEDEEPKEYVAKGSIKEEPKEVSAEEIEETEEVEETDTEEAEDIEEEKPHNRKKGGKRFK